MEIHFLGHACFKFVSSTGLKIIIDPYESGGFHGRVGYDPVNEDANIVLVTHDHLDHSCVAAVQGNFEILRKSGTVQGIKFDVLEAYHDSVQGTLRGGVVNLFCFELDGIRICHASDLGEFLSEKKIAKLGNPDILIIPVGGFYTLGPNEAAALCKKIAPSVVIPMHYKTEKCGFDIQPVDPFLTHFSHIETCSQKYCISSPQNLPCKMTVFHIFHSR